MYVRPANIERAFLLLTVSSNVGDQINSVRKAATEAINVTLLVGNVSP